MVKVQNGGIKDILPPNLISPETLSISYAMENAQKRMMEFALSLHLYAEIEQVPDRVLDLLALEVRTQYYEQTMPRKMKERLVMQTLAWYMHAGTPSILEEFLGTVLEGGYIEEWYAYGGSPYHFKAYALTGDNELHLGYGTQVKRSIEAYKNIRSWLEFFMFIIQGEYHVPVDYQSGVTFSGCFSPRTDVRLKLDGKWKLDGKRKLSRYEDAGNRYPSSITIRTHVNARTGTKLDNFSARTEVYQPIANTGTITFIGKTESTPVYRSNLTVRGQAKTDMHTGDVRITVVNQLNGKWKLDGTKKLNGGLYLR